jgi:hypothetical protein
VSKHLGQLGRDHDASTSFLIEIAAIDAADRIRNLVLISQYDILKNKPHCAKTSTQDMSKVDFEALARFLPLPLSPFQRRVDAPDGITPLQYQLMLQIRAFPAVNGPLWNLQNALRRSITGGRWCELAGLVVQRIAAAHAPREVELTKRANDA